MQHGAIRVSETFVVATRRRIAGIARIAVGDEPLLEKGAKHVSIVDVSVPHKDRRRSDPAHREMRRIVESIYRPPLTSIPGIEIGRAYLNARSDAFRYGGDLVDVFHYGNGLTSVAVVDITGHGIHAAMNAGLTKHALRGYASCGLSAQDSVRSFNKLCIENSTFEPNNTFYATVFFGIVNAQRDSMQYVSAGHEAAYVLEPNRVTRLLPTGPMIGVIDDDSEFIQRVVPLGAASTFAAVTDGFSEARNEHLEFLGSDTLVRVVARHGVDGAERQAEALTQCAFEYTSGDLHDDIAALVVRIVSTE